MAKIRETIGDAVIDVEGDSDTITAALWQFHRAIADAWVREIEKQIQPLLNQRRLAKKLLAKLDSEKPPPVTRTVQ